MKRDLAKPQPAEPVESAKEVEDTARPPSKAVRLELDALRALLGPDIHPEKNRTTRPPDDGDAEA